MIFSDGTIEQSMEVQEQYDSTFPILIDDGTIFSSWDPEYVTPKSIWIQPGLVIEEIDSHWNNEMIEEKVNGE